MSEKYFDKEFATVEYKPDSEIVVARMTEYADGEEFHAYMNSILDAVTEKDCPSVLADTRDHPPLDQADQNWSVETWGPKAEQAGVKQMATLAPESVVSKMSVESVTENAGSVDDIERRWFEEYEDAASWLEAN
jgi:hypothetical protein